VSRGTSKAELLRRWRAVPRRIQRTIAGLDGRELDRRGGSQGLSVREYAHHLVEANLVACSMIVAALGSSGATYDWSWLYPDRAWMRRLGYSRAPVRPALEALHALCEHVSGLLSRSRGGLSRRVRLFDAPGEKPYTMTVARILEQEVEHAGHHLADVRAILGRRAPR